ncbi:MAG: POTRA domain-containing protein [Vicinamibacterales bacterium]
MNFLPAPATAQTPAVVEVVVEQEGAPVTDPVIRSLLKTTPGAPLDMRDVRESISHFMSLNRYEDVQVFQEDAGGGVRLRYVLTPAHPIDRLEFRGSLGLGESALRDALVARFGPGAVNARAEELQRELLRLYRDHGYVSATVTPRVEQTHMPDRASLVFDIAAGPRAAIASLDLDTVPLDLRGTVVDAAGLREGQPYDAAAIQAALDRQQAALRARGYYQAQAVHFATFDPAGGARVAVTLDRGPLISVAFEGDPLTEDERERLVPIEAEASADEDLLEDSSRAIETYLKAGGYRDALVDYQRVQQGDDALTITFRVSRGPRYITELATVSGNTAISTDEILQALQVKPGAPYVQEDIDEGLGALRNAYRARGYTRPELRAGPRVLPDVGGDRRVELVVSIAEGPRARVGTITIDGNTVFSDDELRAMMGAAAGRPFNEVEVATDRDRIDLEYRNRGYDGIVVEPRVTLVENDTRADVQFVISEGPQVFVDQVIILGNERTSVDTIQRELTLRSGEPLGYERLLESQQRLSALGLFRRIQITPLVHPGEARRDILVQVEEAPPTTLGYGGGLEGTFLLRATGAGGQAEERFEVAPRGFFEIGRRNLFGKNRTINLFTRVSLRSRDARSDDDPQRLMPPASSYGFHEYRVLGTYREPRLFNSRIDALVTGIFEQARRSSFNFRAREARAEAGIRLSPRYSMAGRFSFRHITLFDEQFGEDEAPLIDKLFPQVRIAKLATSLIRDTRDDVLYPNRGSFAVADAELAARSLGSEVGFVKTFVQAFTYLPLPSARRTILALGARVGAAHGFALADTAGEDGEAEVLLPASERFFAGGDTTVRGFSLDRLGDENTIGATGFPTGGNGEIVLNAELRVSVLNNRAEVVGFVDAGNIFERAGDLDLTSLRPAVGFGGRYRSPVGPIRVDLGFNVDRRELTPGTLERGYVLHISLGQAF